MFETFTSNLSIMMLALWGCFMTYASWYFTKAKRYSPITPTEARQLWTIHKHDTRCNGRKWRQVKNGKQTVGFQCECGYRHMQKRPLVTRTPAALDSPRVSAFDRLHTSHKSA
jgi:hypothetical protein